MSSLPGVLRYSCCANGCGNNYYNPLFNEDHVNKKFFRFPEKHQRRRQWFKIMNLAETDKRRYLCEDHFEDSAFTGCKNKLIKFAMPSNKSTAGRNSNASCDVASTSAESLQIINEGDSSHSNCTSESTQLTEDGTIIKVPELKTSSTFVEGMATTQIISLSMIADFFRDDLGELCRGEKLYQSGNVDDVVLEVIAEPAILKGTVTSPLGKRKYSVEVVVNAEDESILYTGCTCHMESACHHVAALLLYTYHNSGSMKFTSEENEEEEVKTISDIYPEDKSYSAICGDIPEENIRKFYEKLEESGAECGFTWLLRQRFEGDEEEKENISSSKE